MDWSNHMNPAYGRLASGFGLGTNSTLRLVEPQGFGTTSGNTNKV